VFDVLLQTLAFITWESKTFWSKYKFIASRGLIFARIQHFRVHGKRIL